MTAHVALLLVAVGLLLFAAFAELGWYSINNPNTPILFGLAAGFAAFLPWRH